MFRLICRPLMCALLGFSVLLSAGATKAQGPPVYFVGVQRGCEREGRLDQAVERRLNKQGVAVALLRKPSGEALPVCYGEGCGRRVGAACPSAGGRVLGGAVQQDRDMLQVRLWLHDLQSGATAYQDDYCQGCDIVSAVATQAARLVAAPVFGAAPGGTPSYCGGTAGAVGTLRPAAGALVLTVFGEGKHKAALLSALKQQLAILGYKVDAQPLEAGKNVPDPKKLVAGHKNARVLGVEVPKEGKLQLFLYDQRTEQTEGKLLDCDDCDGNKDTLIARVQPEVSSILDHCFGDACTQMPTNAATPPPIACTPFPDLTCGATHQSTESAALPPRHIDNNTASLIKAALWTPFAASAATAIGLAIANETPAGIVVSQGHEHYQTLTRPAWMAASVAGLCLALAIPATIFVHRAEQAGARARLIGGADPAISCPK